MAELDVLVPMKQLALAKSRLSPEIPRFRRQGAALWMLDHVLDAILGICEAEACKVIGGGALVRWITEGKGCIWLHEPGYDLNSSLWESMRMSFKQGSRAILFLPADLPKATTAGVAQVIIGSWDLSRPVGVQALNDGGTNALLLPKAISFLPQLGMLSYARHSQEIDTRGMKIFNADAPDLSFDVDTPWDLRWAENHVDGFAVGIERWERWLEKNAATAMHRE